MSFKWFVNSGFSFGSTGKYLFDVPGYRCAFGWHSDLETFSLNHSTGSFAPLTDRTTVRTCNSSRVKQAYRSNDQLELHCTHSVLPIRRLASQPTSQSQADLTQPSEPILSRGYESNVPTSFTYTILVAEAPHLGGLMQIWVRPATKITPPASDLQTPTRANRTPQDGWCLRRCDSPAPFIFRAGQFRK
eukprot:TsM_000412500 transcript=TsM_000412500 gene=TsM_000412500